MLHFQLFITNFGSHAMQVVGMAFRKQTGMSADGAEEAFQNG